MKKVMLLFVALVSLSFALMAQSYRGMIDIVHLKNGSVIRGIIVEQIPNETIKLKTADGSLFVYQTSEVAKITKEEGKLKNQSGLTTNNYLFDRTGYRGFVDFGYSFGVGDAKVDRLELSTSHGYQFNPYFYLGGGVNFTYYPDLDDRIYLPIFVNPRVNFLTGPITPFLDFKIGYNFIDEEGLYLSPSLGTSFRLENNKAINVSLGYTLQKISDDVYYDGYYWGNYSVDLNAVTLKVGFEF